MYYILNARTAEKVMIDPFNTLDEACNMAVSYSINIRDPIDVVTEVGGSKFTTPHRQHYTHYHLGKEISANKRKDLLKMIPRKKKANNQIDFKFDKIGIEDMTIDGIYIKDILFEDCKLVKLSSKLVIRSNPYQINGLWNTKK